MWARQDEVVSTRCFTLGVSELELERGETGKCPPQCFIFI